MAFRPVPPTCQPRPKGEDGLVTLARDDLVFQFHVEVIESRERRLPVGVEVNQGAAVPQLASVAGCVTSTQRTRSDSSASLLEAQVTVRLATTRTIPTVAVALVSLFMTLPFFNPLCLNAWAGGRWAKTSTVRIGMVRLIRKLGGPDSWVVRFGLDLLDLLDMVHNMEPMVGDQFFEVQRAEERMLPGSGGQVSGRQSADQHDGVIQKPHQLLSSLLDRLHRPAATVARREGSRRSPDGEVTDALGNLPGRGVDQMVQHFVDRPLVAGLKARLLLTDTPQAATAVGGGALHEDSQVGQTFGGLVADVGEGLLCPFVPRDH